MQTWAGSAGQAQIMQSKYSLAKIGILVGLPPAALERIQRRCSWKGYEPGEPIVDYLDSSDNVFFITEGEARVTIYSLSGKAVSFRELAAGDMFGEFPAIDQGPRSQCGGADGVSCRLHAGCRVSAAVAEGVGSYSGPTPKTCNDYPCSDITCL